MIFDSASFRESIAKPSKAGLLTRSNMQAFPISQWRDVHMFKAYSCATVCDFHTVPFSFLP